MGTELIIGILGVAVGGLGTWFQAQSNHREQEQIEDRNDQRLAHLEARMGVAIDAGREIKRDLTRIDDRLHNLEIQVSRVLGFLDQERRVDE